MEFLGKFLHVGCNFSSRVLHTQLIGVDQEDTVTADAELEEMVG